MGLGGGPDPESTGTVQLFLQQIPSDISCIQIIAEGSIRQANLFPVTPGAASTITMPGVPSGSVKFSGAAYPIACASVTPSTVPTWIADPKTVTIVSGSTTNLTLSMRPAGNAGVTVDFVGGAGSGGVVLGVWNSTNWNNAIWQ